LIAAARQALFRTQPVCHRFGTALASKNTGNSLEPSKEVTVIQSAASTIQANSVVNQADITGLPTKIVNAIQTAANETGVDFSYLLKKASQESSLNPNAKASGSSATGLYQFTQQTWLQMVKNYGGQYGLGTYADHIQMDSNGVAHVSDPTWKQAILNLRKDPVASAEMAGELDKENQTALEDKVGGKIGGTELYLAHFLGAGGASTFLNEMQENPKQTAADVLPTAAAANPAVFYAKDGTPRSLQQIYQHFAQKFETGSSTTLIASATSTKSAPASTTASLANATISGAATTVASATPYVISPIGVSSSAATAMSAATNNLKSQGSSLFATMVLAQMNEASASALSSTSNSATNQNNKKTPFDLMNLAAVG
jgi:hypothetical protein